MYTTAFVCIALRMPMAGHPSRTMGNEEGPPMTIGMRAYADQVQGAISGVDLTDVERIVDVLNDAVQAGRRVFTMGNGASAALASHMACDLGKGTAVDVGPRSDRGIPRRG